MSQSLLALSLWLHALATVIFIGHYLLLALVYLPAITGNRPDVTSGRILGEISKRSRLWLYVSLGVFIITGVYLLTADPSYRGIGNFSNLWAALMLVKHIIIVGMIVAGFWFNAILRVGSMAGSSPTSLPAARRLRSFVNGMAITGVVVLLLTAVAQTQ